MIKSRLFYVLIACSLMFSSCFEDQDDNFTPASTLEIQNFIYRGLNLFYLYKGDTPELANGFFTNQTELDTFLSTYNTPEDLFGALKSSQDRFSILVDDYITLENSLNGITLNNGMEFGFVRLQEGSDILFGYVRYVLPNTDAESKEVQRGMLFSTIDGQQITVGNRLALIAPDSYTIGLATLNGNSLTPTGESINLSKAQYTEDPVFIAKTLTIEGQKIGYLMYNAFNRNFDIQLNQAFGQFKADAVNDLILDLRYNSGGSVENAVDLASMITGQFNGQVFYQEQWNAELQESQASDGLFDTTISDNSPTNSLGLTRIYVLTTTSTASASELTINGLNPYINVVQVGDNTSGKYQASFTLYDSPDFTRSDANPNHTYAMQPLVFKTANKIGFTDFDEGLEPTIPLREDYNNLGTLGNVNEPLLAAAINQIFPGRYTVNQNFKPREVVSERKASLPGYQVMVADFNN